MARPTEDEAATAVATVGRFIAIARAENIAGTTQASVALSMLEEASQPRPVWPVKEVAEYLDVRPENVRPEKLRGLPEPAQEFPRGTARHPEKTMRLFFADEIEAYRLVLEATPRRRNAREKGGR